MHDSFKIKEGLDIPVQGTAEKCFSSIGESTLFAVKPSDYVGLVPKMAVKGGEKVLAGTPLFFDKSRPEICFSSPVSGTVKEVVRGDRRAVLAVVVESDGKHQSLPFTTDTRNRKSLVDAMLASGIWTLLRQRPFGIVADPSDNPRAIYVSCFDSAPLAPDFDFLLQGHENDFLAGVKVLARLTDGKLHLSFRKGQNLLALCERIQPEIPNLALHTFCGPHPAGLVGTQIAKIDPINAGEKVWTINPQGVADLGHLAEKGEYYPRRAVAFAGPVALKPCYYETFAGANVASMTEEQMAGYLTRLPEDVYDYRLISGNVLSGSRIESDGFLGAYDSLLSVLPEGTYYDFMGWLMPGFRKFSFSRTFLSGFMARCSCLSSKATKKLRYRFDTNFHGEERPFVVTGSFERVVPLDIYPLQLIKAAIVGDIELMENLGIYEVEPEDLALCEFIDTSKTEIQYIIREALEKCRKEGC